MAARFITVESNAELRDLRAVLWRRFYEQEHIAQGLSFGEPLDYCPGNVERFLALAPEFRERRYGATNRVWVTVQAPIRGYYPLDRGAGGVLVIDDDERLGRTVRTQTLSAWLDSLDGVGVQLPSAANLDGQDEYTAAMRVLGLGGVRNDVRTYTPTVAAAGRRTRAQLTARWEATIAAAETESGGGIRPF